jgi:hypothetical protein
MAAQWDPTPSGVFINDLHALAIHVKPDPPPGLSDPVPGGPSLVSPNRQPQIKGSGAPTAMRWRSRLSQLMQQ